MNKRILFVMFAIIQFSFLSAQNFSQVLQNYGAAVGRIEILNRNGILVSSGTGFVIEESGKIISNAHVVKQAYYGENYSVTIIFEQSEDPERAYYAEIVSYSEELDLSLLQLEESFPISCLLGPREKPPLMEPIMVVGYPLGQRFKSTPGYIQAFQDIPASGEMVDLSAPVNPGNSGGPVFNQNGEVIAVVRSYIPGYNFNLAIPISTVIDFLAGDEGRVDLIINSDPTGSRVFMNGLYKGVTPLELSMIRMDYEIRIEADDYQYITEEIALSENTELDFNLVPIESTKIDVTINTNPSGADIYVNNRYVGESPVTFEADPFSKLRIRAEHNEYENSYETITTTAESEQEYQLDF